MAILHQKDRVEMIKWVIFHHKLCSKSLLLLNFMRDWTLSRMTLCYNTNEEPYLFTINAFRKYLKLFEDKTIHWSHEVKVTIMKKEIGVVCISLKEVDALPDKTLMYLQVWKFFSVPGFMKLLIFLYSKLVQNSTLTLLKAK